MLLLCALVGCDESCADQRANPILNLRMHAIRLSTPGCKSQANRTPAHSVPRIIITSPFIIITNHPRVASSGLTKPG